MFSFSKQISLLIPTFYTKRTLLSEIATIFDPIGWLAPLIIVAKILMQRVHQLKTAWDKALPENIQQQWLSFKQDLSNLKDLEIPRYYSHVTSTIDYSSIRQENVQYCLIGFSDTSERAFSAVVYLGIYRHNQSPIISLVMSKTRVAPCKTVSIPRLELCGALLLA